MRRLPLDILAADSTHSHPCHQSVLLALIRYRHGMKWWWTEISRIKSVLQVTLAGGTHFILEPNQTSQMGSLGDLTWSQEAWPCSAQSSALNKHPRAAHGSPRADSPPLAQPRCGPGGKPPTVSIAAAPVRP